MNSPYPLGMGDIVLPLPEYAGNESPILLGARIFQPEGQYYLFAESHLVKAQLESRIDLPVAAVVHPSFLEIRAVIATITYLERVAIDSQRRWGSGLKIINHDNWGVINGTFIRLFEADCGFIARWPGDQFDELEAWMNEPRFRVADLAVTALAEECGKAYHTSDGRLLLEYVDRI